MKNEGIIKLAERLEYLALPDAKSGHKNTDATTFSLAATQLRRFVETKNALEEVARLITV